MHLVPASVRNAFFSHRFIGGGFGTEYESWSNGVKLILSGKEVALTLKQHLEPKDSLVAGAIGALGYYSGLHIYDLFGLVDRRVAMQVVQSLRYPGHDKKVQRLFFSKDEPTIMVHTTIDGPPPNRTPSETTKTTTSSIAAEFRRLRPGIQAERKFLISWAEQF